MKPKKELNNFQFSLHKMTGQSLKLGKFMTDQAVNTFGHARWPSVISTPASATFLKPSINTFQANVLFFYPLKISAGKEIKHLLEKG